MLGKDIEIETAGQEASYPLKFTLPILFGVGSKKDQLIINSGSVTLIEIDSNIFFITCHHVIESFIEKLTTMKADEKPLFQVGNFSINARPPIIDQSKELDLVTIKMDRTDHESMKRNYKPGIGDSFINTIEHEDIKVNNKITIGGFPGKWKKKIYPELIRFYSFSASFAVVTSVKENEIICQLDDLNSWPKISGAKDSLEDPGGLSGCPAFIVKTTEAGVIHWPFVGIVREGTFIAGSLIIYIRLATCINQDGTIKQPI